eukprot:NODE_7008_length_820_cov_20.078910_g6407_i0.p1 GENE.NODE_7008_length_820_cov_20.078910_g6407_i0~~NODE_7008_length_820_cov_20.078910_g6407_i0.p1  ORF type:complete len:246 (-),score=51.23 NODE_7008_length_820_cov_20.078910_g6407_i0:37-774(-)
MSESDSFWNELQDIYKSCLSKYQGQIQELQEKNENLWSLHTNSIRAHQEEMALKNSLIIGLQTKAKYMEDVIEELTAKLNLSNEKYEKIEKELENLRPTEHKALKLESQLTDIQASVLSNETELTEVLKKLGQSQDNYNKLEKKYFGIQETLQGYEEKLTLLESERKKLERRLEEETSKYCSLSEEKEMQFLNHQKETDLLRRSIKKFEQRVKEMEVTEEDMMRNVLVRSFISCKVAPAPVVANG